MSHGKQALALALLAAASASQRETQHVIRARRGGFIPASESTGQLVNPQRREKKAIMRELGLSSRQWVRFKKARQRAARVAASTEKNDG